MDTHPQLNVNAISYPSKHTNSVIKVNGEKIGIEEEREGTVPYPG